MGRSRAPLPRLSDDIALGRRLASLLELAATIFVLGLLLAAVVAGVIGAVIVAIQHALHG